jgi:predicted TIM-barrel enzyme
LQIAKPARANILGDVRAEHDREMLQRAFLEWQNHLSLFEATDRFIVVGRRGTGKSALTYRLQKMWQERKVIPLVIAPEEESFGKE